ncbi:MAG: ferritin-like domain-containing protein [Alphaproteobacteria bacterium]
MTNLAVAFKDETTPPAALQPEPFSIGSEAHKRAFCGVLLDIFNPYKPSILAWPRLSPDAEKRLTGLPFWDVAVETEGYASSRMQAMADTVTDPLIKEAIALNAFEEGRHKLVIRNMLRFYGIPLKAERPYSAPQDAEWKFICTGYGECFDSFFAFGLFKMAKDSGYFPPELVDVFEPVVQEEARHIMFFVNWVAYTAANQSLLGRIWFRTRCLAALITAALGRVSLAGVANDGAASDNFVVTGGETLTKGLTPRSLVEVALAEDSRRMSSFNPYLLRPRIMPFLARMALKVLPA